MDKPNFSKALDVILKHEGGYSLDSDDPGGETYNGVTRRDWGQLSMWKYIDQVKAKHGAFDPIHLDDGGQKIIRHDVETVAEWGYWTRLRCEKWPNHSLAVMGFDTAYNMGVHRAAGFVQRASNKMNRMERIYPNMVEDGVIGPTTLRHLALASHHGMLPRIFSLFKAYRITFYSELMERSEKFEKYPGWIDRAESFRYAP